MARAPGPGPRHRPRLALDMRMKLYDRQKRVRERALSLITLRGGAGRPVPADRSLIRFTYPNDIRGTGFLVWEHPDADDERFLYLPSLGRVRRIAGAETQESFVGSDFTYEDIGGREFDDYTYAFAAPDGETPLDAAGRRRGAPGLAARVAPQGRVRRVSARRLARAQGHLRRRRAPTSTTAATRSRRSTRSVASSRSKGIWTVMDVRDDQRASRRPAPSSSSNASDYNVGLKEADFSRRELERGGTVPAQLRQVSVSALADFIYRWRIPLSVAHRARRDPARRRAPTSRKIDNDITAWFSQDDPVYRDYERFREEFGGTRALIIALKADSAERLFSRETLELHRRDHRRHRARRHRPARQQPGHRDDRRGARDDATATTAASTSGRSSRTSTRAIPAEIRRRALDDELIRGDLVSDDGTTTAIIVSFDEDRIDEVRGGVIQQIHEHRRSEAAGGRPRLLQRQPRDQRDLQPHHARQPAQVHAADPAVHDRWRSTSSFRSWRKTLLTMFAVAASACSGRSASTR